ncbi:MAG: gliding motility-associated C-terminal domain-containing protein [Bacteroidota bacterium]
MRYIVLTLIVFFHLLPAHTQTPEIRVSEETATVGATISVPVQVWQFTDVVSVQFTLQWDPTIIQYLGNEAYGLPGLSEFNFGEPEVDQGRLTFVWFDGQVAGVSLADETTIFALQFQVLGEAGESSPISFIDAPTPIQIGVIEGIDILEVEGELIDGAVTIESETEPLDVSVSTVDNNCFGESQGSITPSVGGGVTPYEFNWTGPNGFTSTANQLDNLASGDYELTVTDQAGEVFTMVYTISSPPPLQVSNSSVQDSDCDTNTGSIEIEADGGTPPYQYDFGTGFSTNNLATNLMGDSYTITIQDNLGCELDTLVEVAQANAPTVSLGEDISLCPGETATILAEASADVSFNWLQDGQVLGNTTANLEVDQAGTYEVVVTNMEGCTASDALQLTVASIPELDLGPDTSICPKIAYFLIADGSFATYEWTLDGQNTGSDDPELAVSIDGTYTLTATSDEGCVLSDTVLIELIQFPTSAGPDTTIVAGEPLELIATGGTTYQWAGAIDFSCTDCPNPLVMPLSTTTVSVDIVSPESCVLTETLNIQVEEAPELDVNIVNFLSPNGDGKNDVLFFRGLDNYPANQLSVFNRWGDLLFSKPNYQQDGLYWDATFNGQLLPAGVYYYVLQVGTTAAPIKSSLTIVHP